MRRANHSGVHCSGHPRGVWNLCCREGGGWTAAHRFPCPAVRGNTFKGRGRLPVRCTPRDPDLYQNEARLLHLASILVQTALPLLLLLLLLTLMLIVCWWCCCLIRNRNFAGDWGVRTRAGAAAVAGSDAVWNERLILEVPSSRGKQEYDSVMWRELRWQRHALNCTETHFWLTELATVPALRITSPHGTHT